MTDKRMVTEDQKMAIIQDAIIQTARDLQREKRREYDRRYYDKHRDEIERRRKERWRGKAIALIRQQAASKTGLFESDDITAQDFDRFLNKEGGNE